MTNILAARLGEVIKKHFSPDQFTFLKGRMLVDSVLVVNEMIDMAKKASNHRLIFKVEFEKTYDL